MRHVSQTGECGREECGFVMHSPRLAKDDGFLLVADSFDGLFLTNGLTKVVILGRFRTDDFCRVFSIVSDGIGC